MQRWDYACVQVVKSYGVKYRVNGKSISEWNDIPLFAMLQNMGNKGFEMVSIDGEMYIFKRPTPQKSNGITPLQNNDIVASSGYTSELERM
ncbi:hypothetical protein G4Y79_09800 [Phototrophicus methaneseepsis]|uniref:Uncharacterized protein n=1 Tax=Phototrophicus methaneseepsis TaxID=2710758 RepID=A0A7S8ECW4_9CHLR|nr:hypothetical protein [Phototrophicus methaneseepsis]QPC84647.1 hypothetical protein G4Y79_09800 [Phototrophicus methaneseepsis]